MKKENKISKEINISTENACKVIASAAQEACKAIASAAVDAKIVLAKDAVAVARVSDKKENGANIMSFLYKQVSFGLSVVAIVIGAFIYLTDPTTKNDTALQLQDQRITAQRQTIDELTKTSQNDTQEVKAALKELVVEIGSQQVQIAELKTILQERLPVNKNME